MGFVVKIMGDSSVWPQWIGHSSTIDHKALAPRDEARVFQTAIEAEWEAAAFRVLLPDGIHFEIQDEGHANAEVQRADQA
jgi:hypothetical protein